jgi:hypothetical protein
MNKSGGIAGCYLALLALACAAAAPASASTPSLTWRDVRQVAVHCNIQDERTGFNAALTRQLCDKVRGLAAVGAPVPLQVVGFGDRALTAPDSVTLVVQGTAAGPEGSRSLMFTVRPYRPSPDQPAELFGSTLRVAPLLAPDEVIEQALAEVLPWKAQPLGARPIP